MDENWGIVWKVGSGGVGNVCAQILTAAGGRPAAGREEGGGGRKKAGRVGIHRGGGEGGGSWGRESNGDRKS